MMRKIMVLVPVVLGFSILALGCGGGGGSAERTAAETAGGTAAETADGTADETAGGTAAQAADASPATDRAEATPGSDSRGADGRGGAGYRPPSENPAANPAMVETASLEVSGQLGCGHCTFGVKDECSLAMKTESGEVYLIEAGDRQEELMDKRLDEPSVKIQGQVGEVDGRKIIYAKTVELY